MYNTTTFSAVEQENFKGENFSECEVCGYLAKVFSLKFGGGDIIWQQQWVICESLFHENFTYFPSICESFFPHSFLPLYGYFVQLQNNISC